MADTSLITAVANDYSFDVVFARQIESLCRPGDVAVGLSTSGNSANVLQGDRRGAPSIGALTVGFTGGEGGKLARSVDIPIVVPHAADVPRAGGAPLPRPHALRARRGWRWPSRTTDVRSH